MANGRLGMNGTAISRMLDGRWVTTIVFRRPMRPAIQAAASEEPAASRLATKRIPPRPAGGTPQREANQKAMKL